MVDTMRWRGSMPPGSKLFAATCPLCEAVVSASILLDPHENRSMAPRTAAKGASRAQSGLTTNEMLLQRATLDDFGRWFSQGSRWKRAKSQRPAKATSVGTMWSPR